MSLSKYYHAEKYIQKFYPNCQFLVHQTSGLSNETLIFEVFNDTEIIRERFIFKIFGNVSQFIDREEEKLISDKLSELGLSPRMIQSDRKTYRIEEFFDNSKPLSKEDVKNYLDPIINLISKFNNTFGLVEYYLMNGSTFKIKEESQLTRLPDNFLFNIIPNSKEKIFNLISEIEGQINMDNKKISHWHFEERKNLNLIMQLLNNFQTEFYSNYPTNGIFCLNHHDLHCLNILVNENDKNHMKIIDLEFNGLNLIGYDIANFLIELSFDYSNVEYPFYTYKKFDVESAHKIYLKYLQSFDPSKLGNKREIYDIKYFKYLCRLTCLFWVAIESLYCNLSQKSFSYSRYIIDRMSIYDDLGRDIKN